MGNNIKPWYLTQNRQYRLEKFKYIENEEDHRLKNANSFPTQYKWSFGVSINEQNIYRNRYINIMPYEYNRVKLNVIEGNDYINASHIHLNIVGQSTKQSHYIATQGPTKRTWMQFWQMCYQQCPGTDIVIVMVTPLSENGKIKCHNYWPRNGSFEITRDQYPGGIDDLSLFSTGLNVEFLSEKQESYYKVTELLIRPNNLNYPSKKVHHFYFESWRDMCKPDQIIPAITLSQHSHSITSKENPIIVHCSAGVGRTGTFIALDHFLHNISEFKSQEFIYNHERDIIEEIVLQLRLQRLKMVQMYDQYSFIYDAINLTIERPSM